MADIEKIKQSLKEVIDPEIGMNVVDLNMIKDIEITNDVVKVKMVLTVPGCPLAAFLKEEVKRKTEEVSEGKKVTVEMLDEKWVPPNF
ncbi:MAG: hypothetical protein B5M53_05635 [Candidatus Cloacimonas sp. 4484_209]|nr:MAG: hypothetical protein B5M53_05635 [Candidatus Cloacimonas sp. 4484_209]